MSRKQITVRVSHSAIMNLHPRLGVCYAGWGEDELKRHLSSKGIDTAKTMSREDDPKSCHVIFKQDKPNA